MKSIGCLIAVLVLTLGQPILRGAEPAQEDWKELNKLLQDLEKTDGEPGPRREAAEKIAKLVSKLNSVASRLSMALSDPDEGVRLHALKAFEDLGSLGESYAWGIQVSLLGDSSAAVRAEAAHALAVAAKHIPTLRWNGQDSAISALAKAVKKDESKLVRCMAANVLGSFGPEAKEAVPALAEALKEKNEPGFTGPKDSPLDRVCIAAAISLSRIGPDAKAAVPALLEVVKDSDDVELKRVAVAALGRAAPLDEKVFPVLLGAAQQVELRAVGVGVLGLAGPAKAKESLPVLRKALDVKEIKDRKYADWIQGNAIEAIGRMGEAGKDDLPAIEAILNDPETGPHAQIMAMMVIKQLRP
jgi:HEAT repeats